MNRAERRWRNKRAYNRKTKEIYYSWMNDIPCPKEEAPVQTKWRRNNQYWRKAENWKEFQDKNPSIKLYKNTRTKWDHGYWNKFSRHLLNKQSRMNAKLDIRNGDEVIFERVNLK